MTFHARMTMDEAAAVAGPVANDSPSARVAAMIAAAILLLGIAQQAWLGLDTDVSWLLTVGERMIGGDRLYVDIFEVNPPASVLLYLPAIVAARAIGARPEVVTVALTLALALGSIVLSGRMIGAAKLAGPAAMRALGLTGLFALTILPSLCFAQREHIALILVLPYVVLAAGRAGKRPVSHRATLLAGIGAGLAMVIKPHFALALLPVALATAWRRRSARFVVAPVHWIAGLVVALYAALIAYAFPAFLAEALPLLGAVYLPARAGLAQLLFHPVLVGTLIVACAALWAGRGNGRTQLVFPLLLAAAGFTAAALVQGKYYLNHLYPAAALAVLALGAGLADAAVDPARRRRAMAAGLTGIAILLPALGLAIHSDAATVAAVIRKVAPPHPGIVTIGSNLDIGHPVTRWVDGHWDSRRGAMWATGAAIAQLPGADPARRRALQAYIDQDRAIIVADIARQRPDVVLVDRANGPSWIARNADARSVMSRYRPVATTGKIIIYRRR